RPNQKSRSAPSLKAEGALCVDSRTGEVSHRLPKDLPENRVSLRLNPVGDYRKFTRHAPPVDAVLYEPVSQ
ncbi:MAG: hypothetical protein L7F78_22270, partial [Syntrophales bacterium LBB04]|nr:hypothetical protein [Syntrophales bacterium LBB04]